MRFVCQRALPVPFSAKFFVSSRNQSRYISVAFNLWVVGDKQGCGSGSWPGRGSPRSPTKTEPPRSGRPAERPAELPAAWREITRVEPQRFPDSDAVVLRRRVSYTLGSSPALTSGHEVFVQVLTAEGKRFGDFDVSYWPPQENVTFLDCEVLRPDGKLLRLDPDDMREGAEESLGDYRAARRKFFSLPGVVPGAVLRVRYRSEWQTYPLPHVSLAIPLTDEQPIIDAAIHITVPKDAAFHFAFQQNAPSDPTIKPTAHGNSYSWQFKDVAARVVEALTPPDSQPALLVSTCPDWAEFARWYGRISKLADEITPEIREQAKELTRDAKTDREKVLALYHFVTGLRYVAVPLGVNSYRPHAAAHVLKNQFGDCKDKANLFNTLLHALGFEARLVLVPRFAEAHDHVPGLAFNHAMSRVALGGETLWVDTTDDMCRFGLLPPGDAGHKVLVIDDTSTALTPLPGPDAEDHRLRIRGRVKCAAGGGAAAVFFEANALGFPDYNLRSTARETKGRWKNLPLLANKFRLTAGSFSLSQQSFTDVSKLDEDFAWQAQGEGVGLWSDAGGRWLLRAPFWVPKEWDVALHPRRTPLFLNEGYPLALEQEIEFALPPNARDILLPHAKQNRSDPLRWQLDWSKAGDATVRARLRVELRSGELPEAAALQNQLRQLLTALASGVIFSAGQ